MKKKGKEIKMLSKAACAFSTGELRLFSLWFKTKSNKTLYQMVYKKQACTLQRSHTRKINLFLTLCHEFLGPLHTTDTDSIPTQVEKTWREEFCTHGHLLAQKKMASGRKTQAFIPPTQKKKSTSLAPANFLATSQWVSRWAGGCVSKLDIFKAAQWEEDTQHLQAKDSAEMNSVLPKVIISEDDSCEYKH